MANIKAKSTEATGDVRNPIQKYGNCELRCTLLNAAAAPHAGSGLAPWLLH